jgi:HEPN domain-containing protein
VVRYLNNSGRLLALIGLCSLLATSLGCKKMLAKYNLGKAQDRTQEAVDNEAQRFLPDRLETTQSKINETQQYIDVENFEAAAESAKQAAQDSKDLLDQTKNLRANDLKEQANFWIGKAKLNEANAENPQRFNDIQKENEDAQQLIVKEKWDKAITAFLKVKGDIEFLLNNLKIEANQGLEEARKMKEDLIAEGAPEHAPESIETMDNQIEEIENLITREYNYRQALLVRNQARQTKQEGVIKTKEVKSRKMITEIENLLEEATQLGANLYALQNYRAITKDFENLLTKFYDKNYDTVLAQAPELKPKAEDLILETKRKGAQAKIEDVQVAINNLTDGQARKYLPGQVEQLDALLDEARGLFDGEEYTQSKEVSQRALELELKIIEDFDNLAQQQIGKAQDELAKAESVFGRMQEIFDTQIPGEWTGADLSLENSKQALKEELRTSLQNSKLSLGVAQLKREDKDFDLAIEISKEVAAASDHIQQQTYRVVSHNAILEISNELTRYERDGGRQYAAAEVDKTYSRLNEAKKLLEDGQYREAVRHSADTKAQLEVVSQELARVAGEQIAKASTALAMAKQHRAEDFQNQTYQQAVVALDRARAALDAESLKEAIESSISAENIATDASTRALRAWTEEFMGRSDDLLARARAAGAERYAPDRLQSAIDMRRNLQRLYEQTSYLAAVDTGRQAVDAANDALYALVIEGDNAIAAARQYGAWEFEPDRLTNAMVSAKYARESIEAGDFRNAELHAQNAIHLAGKLQLEAKRKSFEANMNKLSSRLQGAEHQGAGYYQVGDIVRILSEMNELRAQFDPTAYDDYAKRVELLETRLGSIVESTPDTLRDLVIKMQDRLGEFEARGARTFTPEQVEEVERKIKYAQIDYQAGKYRSSFLNAKDAQKLLDRIRLDLDERQFDVEMNEILSAFTDELRKFGVVLSMGTPTLLRLIVGENGRARAVAIAQTSSPSQFRQDITELGSRVFDLEAPMTRENQKKAAIEMFGIAKTSATNFEKMLILDQYDLKEARDIIQTAFLQMDNARKMQNDLMEAIQYPQARFQPKGVERVVSYRE